MLKSTGHLYLVLIIGISAIYPSLAEQVETQAGAKENAKHHEHNHLEKEESSRKSVHKTEGAAEEQAGKKDATSEEDAFVSEENAEESKSEDEAEDDKYGEGSVCVYCQYCKVYCFRGGISRSL